MIISKAFDDKACTCKCGNKHEFFGGKGYEMVDLDYSFESEGNFYRATYRCNKCGRILTHYERG